MSEPFFSVIIPVYNTEDTLSRTLDSIFAQTFPIDNVEVIIVNDGSPNEEKCDAVVSLYKDRVSINYQKFKKNKGLYLARKTGVEKATGRYLLHLDSDDLFEKDALKVLHDDIKANGDVDYIWFLFNSLHKNGKREIYGLVKDINASNVSEDILTFVVCHNVANKCFNTLFAKETWSKMPNFYAYYNEDYYQMAILHYCSKKRRFIKKPLYVYVQGVGITGVVKYTKEKLYRTILSIYNVDTHLTNFYKQEDCLSYIPLVQNYSDGLYIDCIFRSSFKNFIDIAQNILSKEHLNIITTKYILNLKGQIISYKQREKYFFLIVALCSFIFRYPKKKENQKDITQIIDEVKVDLKDGVLEREVFECVSYLEADLSFYEKRVKFYAPIKFVLRPLWHFIKHIVRR